jgi:hypothetical protein
VLVERLHDPWKGARENRNKEDSLHPRAGKSPWGRRKSTAAIST